MQKLSTPAKKAAFIALFALLMTVLMLTSLAFVSAENAVFSPTTQAQFGTGWTGFFFPNTTLTEPFVYSEQYPNGININWGGGSPNPAVPNDNWSARFDSIQQFNQGTYEFVIVADDGVRLYIDSILVLDQFIERPLTSDRVQQTLIAGAHTLRVEFLATTGQAALQVQWFQVTGVPGFGTPTTIGGFPGIGTPAAPVGCTTTCATVSGARGLALRTGPYLGASFVTTLISGATYTVIARNRDEGIYSWYLLQVGERQGWASGRYLQLNVDINLVQQQGSIFDNFDDAPEYGVIAYPRAVMNIRRRPSPRTPVVGSMPWGGPAQVIGRTIQAGIPRWYQVRYNGVVGWIDARWVSVRGEINAVPIR